MSSALFFLGIALVIAVIGGVVVMVMHRTPPGESGDGVDQFRRFMDALAPEDEPSVTDDPASPHRPVGEG